MRVHLAVCLAVVFAIAFCGIAGAELPGVWGAILARVRERFVAQSPDEALRVR